MSEVTETALSNLSIYRTITYRFNDILYSIYEWTCINFNIKYFKVIVFTNRVNRYICIEGRNNFRSEKREVRMMSHTKQNWLTSSSTLSKCGCREGLEVLRVLRKRDKTRE